MQNECFPERAASSWSSAWATPSPRRWSSVGGSLTAIGWESLRPCWPIDSLSNNRLLKQKINKNLK